MNPDFMKQMGGGGASSFGEDFLGPDYNYYDYIKLPGEMGMSEAGNFKALADNIAGVLNYANVLSLIFLSNIKNLKIITVDRTPIQELNFNYNYFYSNFKL